MKELLLELMRLKSEESKLKEARGEVEAQLYMLIENQLNEGDKTTTIYADEIKLSIKPNFVVKVDQEKAELAPSFFKKKFEMTYSQYKKLENTDIVDEIVTISVNKPTFTVEIK